MGMTKRIAAAGLAGVLGVAGVAVATAPLASAATGSTVTADGAWFSSGLVAATADGDDAAASGGGRLQAIKEALAGLVADGTITPDQADAVATTLDEAGPTVEHGGLGGGGMHLDTAAEALGMTAEELRTAMEVGGTSLADVAAAQGVETSVLVDVLVAQATERINRAVADGRLAQEQADTAIAELSERVAALVEQAPVLGQGSDHGHGGGRGWGGGWGRGPDRGATDGSESAATAGSTT